MTKEELLKPRYKVIADYPGNIYSEGQILKEVSVHLEKFVADGHDQNFQYVERPALYPAVFKKLEWYQDRKPEDMPLYLKRHDKIWKVESWQIDTEGELFFWLERRMNGAKDWYPENTNVFPATEEEYNAYIQKHTTNG